MSAAKCGTADPGCRDLSVAHPGFLLKTLSQVMIDKAQTVPVEKIGEVFGHLDDATMVAGIRALAVWLGFA